MKEKHLGYVDDDYDYNYVFFITEDGYAYMIDRKTRGVEKIDSVPDMSTRGLNPALMIIENGTAHVYEYRIGKVI